MTPTTTSRYIPPDLLALPHACPLARSSAAGPRDIRLHLAATVKDVVIQDLRAALEHSLVLIPHGGEEFCSLEAAFTTFVDPRKAGPRLNVHMLVGVQGGQ